MSRSWGRAVSARRTPVGPPPAPSFKPVRPPDPDGRPAGMPPVTRSLVPDSALRAIEAAMRAGEAEHGERWRQHPALHHVRKGVGHALSAGRSGRAIDEDSGQRHLALAATRLVLALAVLLDQERSC